METGSYGTELGLTTFDSGTSSHGYHFCMSGHTIRRVHAQGSNQHKRRETGMCIHCKKPFRRVIDWDQKGASGWWEPIEDAA